MSTNLRKEILFLAAHHRTFSMGDLIHECEKKVSRQYLSTQVKQLVAEGELVKVGSGRWTRYALPKHAEELSDRVTERLQNNKVLEEHKVYDGFKRRVSGLSKLHPNVGHIVSYGFTEMLNNVIDHSSSKGVTVSMDIKDSKVEFTVIDQGVGVFRNVMRSRKLANELEAIQDLTKGKITTQSDGHTGEGIFFTSRAGDVFILESYGYRLRIDNTIPDLFVEKVKGGIRGTKVTFEISTKSKKDLGEIFRQFQVDPAEGVFDVTEIKVKLYKDESTEYVSRSQAKRLLTDLGGRFKKIVLDFEGIPTIGQGFADQVFRVFQNEYPEISIVPVNMSKEVEFMINRVNRPEQSLFES